MAGTIKGITIEIDGKIDGFKKALADANKSIKDTQKQLKDVNKLLKLDPKNTELLKQKQDLLNKAVKEVDDKLKGERDALAKLKEADQTPEVEEAAKKLERQIVADTDALKKAQKELKEFGSIGTQQFAAVGEKMKEVGGKVSKVGEGLTKNVTAPIVGVGAAALAAFSEVDAGYDTVIQKTGATGQAAQEMYDIVDQLATTMPTDFATAGEAVGEVNTRFGVTGDALADLSEKFIMFAQLNGTDVTSSVDSVQKALEAFGLGADDAGAYLDALNKAAQDSGIGVDTLTSLTIANAGALSEMGLSLEDSTALMAQLEKSGVPVESVMGGLSKALKNATDDGVPLNDALADLQDTIANSEDDAEGLAKAYELFGKQGDKVFKAVKDGAIDFEDLGNTATDSAGNLADTFNETLDPIDEWQTTLNQLKLTGAELGATIGQVLQPILEKVAKVVQDLREKWESLSPQTQQTIVTIAGIIAVVGPIIALIGSIITGIGGLITAVTTVAGVLGVAASTVGIVIAAIAAIIAIIVVCIMHWDEIKAKVKEVWESIVEYVTNLKDSVVEKWEEIKSNISSKVQSIKTDIANKWNAIKADVVNKVTSIKTNAVNKINEMKSSITEKLNGIKQQFIDKFNSIKDKVSNVIESIKGFFSNLSLKLPQIELPAMPHFSISGEFSLNPPSVPHLNVDWWAKAMNTPYMFTSPTVMQTPYGAFGAGEAGHEFMYGYSALMRDITAANAANNGTLIDGFYDAMVAALRTANLTIQIGRREFGRIVKEVL
jgi:phage-related minor tail protein